MTDVQFLMWIYERLVEKGDDELTDFMHKFRDIIYNIPLDKKSPHGPAMNSLDDLKNALREKYGL